MLACFDVQYHDDYALAAGLTIASWSAATPDREWVERVQPIEPYLSGQFYRRELPCLVQLLARLPQLPEVAVIDGFVWLGDEEHPGLGGHLYRHFGGRMAVVGVAKTEFHGAAPVLAILRGQSAKNLYVSAAGMDLTEAAASVRIMAGNHRLPTLLRRVDQLCRGHATSFVSSCSVSYFDQLGSPRRA